jgi:hypothetical protein
MAGFFFCGGGLAVATTVDAFKKTAAEGAWGRMGSIC